MVVYRALLDVVEDSIEISYNSAGVLAHMVSDGEEAWSGLTVKREQVMASVVKVRLAVPDFLVLRTSLIHLWIGTSLSVSMGN